MIEEGTPYKRVTLDRTLVSIVRDYFRKHYKTNI